MGDLFRLPPPRPRLDRDEEREHGPRGRVAVSAPLLLPAQPGLGVAGPVGLGSLYLLSPATFVADEPLAGAIDTAHLVSREPVKPLARIDVTSEDFPFRNRVRYYRDGEPNWISLLRPEKREGDFQSLPRTAWLSETRHAQNGG